MFKMVSHVQIGPLGAKLENRVIKRVIARVAAFFYARRYQNRTPEVLLMFKLVSHVQIGPGRPELASQVLYHIIWRGCVIEVKTSMSSKNSETHRVASTTPLEVTYQISALNPKKKGAYPAYPVLGCIKLG